MMTSDHAALLAAVVEAPADNAPRIIFADWLDEAGTKASVARASFIRAQVILASPDAPLPACDPKAKNAWTIKTRLGSYRRGCRCPYCKLKRQEWVAWAKYGCEWQGEVIRPIVQGHVENFLTGRAAVANAGYWTPPITSEFRRGFLHTLTLPTADWLACGPEIVRRHPVESVTLSGKSPSMEVSARRLYAWIRDDIEPRQAVNRVPVELFAHMPRRGWPDAEATRFFKSGFDAHTALSSAALAWAKATEPALATAARPA